MLDRSWARRARTSQTPANTGGDGFVAARAGGACFALFPPWSCSSASPSGPGSPRARAPPPGPRPGASEGQVLSAEGPPLLARPGRATSPCARGRGTRGEGAGADRRAARGRYLVVVQPRLQDLTQLPRQRVAGRRRGPAGPRAEAVGGPGCGNSGHLPASLRHLAARHAPRHDPGRQRRNCACAPRAAHALGHRKTRTCRPRPREEARWCCRSREAGPGGRDSRETCPQRGPVGRRGASSSSPSYGGEAGKGRRSSGHDKRPPR